MRVLMRFFLPILFFFLFIPGIIYPSETILAQPITPQSSYLSRGIDQYKDEDFEEALEFLTKAREEDPASSMAAFYSGLCHKQLANFKDAAENFRAAIELKPPIKDAVVELIEVLYTIGELAEANQWVAFAEKETIKPAQTAFLKGLILLKENKNLEAIKAFEKAKDLDRSITQAADFQIANAYLKERKLSEAGESFRTVVIVDPNTDLAAFAREYEEAITERLFLEREWRFTVGLAYQYDDNVVLKPEIEIGIPEGEDWAGIGTFGIAYVPRLPGPWTMNAEYSFYANIHQKIETHDIMSNTLTVVPGYNFKNASLNLFLSYNYTLVNDRSYLYSFSANSMISVPLNSNHIGQFSLGYSKKEFLWTETQSGYPIGPNEDRDADVFSASAGWIYLFSKGKGFLNLRYELSKEDTDGKNWDYLGNKVSANILIPLQKRLRMNLSAETFWQDYENVHTEFNVKRDDIIYTASAVLSYEIFRGASFNIQYTYIRDDSNIPIYDYKRNIYTAGIEYRF
jgi:tetratricopeptide (TPR) repeat protein